MNQQSVDGLESLENKGKPAEFNPWRFCVAPMMDRFHNKKTPAESGR